MKYTTVIAGLVLVFALSFAASAQKIPGQLAEDFPAGVVPSPAMVKQFEKDAAAKPTDLGAVRRLGKAYFFQFFGDGDSKAVPKGIATLEKALTITADDPETLAYLGSLHVLVGQRLLEKDPSKQKASYDKGFELVNKAMKLAPRHGAVLSVASGTYLWLPDSYNMAPVVVAMLEGMIKGMGPMFKQFHHHGQQRLLLTLGQAYVRTGKPEKARPLFEEALKVNEKTDEAIILRKELAKLSAAAN